MMNRLPQTMSQRSKPLLLLAGMLLLSGCASYEDLRLFARPPDIPEGGTSNIVMQSLLAPFWPPGGPATAVPGVAFTLTGAACGTLAATTATSDPGGQAYVRFTGATNLTADCSTTINVDAAGTPAAPFSENEDVSLTVHAEKDIGKGSAIGTSFDRNPPATAKYCVYTVATPPSGYTPPPGTERGARPVGTMLCVNCPTKVEAPWGFKFASPTTITVLNGTIYYYVTKTGTTCTNCPTSGVKLKRTNTP